MAGRQASTKRVRRPQEIADGVGPRLRTRRQEQRLSLRELARRLSISPSALSQIETGKSQPSVSTLYAIVSELRMSLDELFGGVIDGARPATDAPPAVASASKEQLQPHASRAKLQLESGVRWERLTATPDTDADFLWVVYEPGGSSSHGDGFIRHAGREYGLVLSGTLEVTVGFDTYELGAGDSISFDSTTPHRLRNTGAEPVEGVWFVVGRGGDARARAFEDERG